MTGPSLYHIVHKNSHNDIRKGQGCQSVVFFVYFAKVKSGQFFLSSLLTILLFDGVNTNWTLYGMCFVAQLLVSYFTPMILSGFLPNMLLFKQILKRSHQYFNESNKLIMPDKNLEMMS